MEGTCFVCHKRKPLQRHHHYWPRKYIKKTFPHRYNELRAVHHWVCCDCHKDFHAICDHCMKDGDRHCNKCRYILICCWI